MRNLFIGLAIALAASAAPATVKSGIEAWQAGDASRAVAHWRPLAEQGDADAAFNLGQAYRLGKGVPLDLGQAQNWLERAARKGHVDAQATLGLLLFQNGNRVTALRWLKGAADTGDARALLMVGTAMFNGDGVPADPVTAYALVSRAAAQGLAPAKATLADMDEILPLEQRQKGVALARQMVAGKDAAPVPAAPRRQAEQPRPATAEPPSRVAAPLTGNWRIQLGAFGKKSSAEDLFARLSGKLGGRQAFYVPVGAMVRLQAGPFESRAAASQACNRLAPQPCFAVAGR
ncbi:SPOR domain-containing protein [Sphingomonas xanthus]|uniref:SPOR domain-containing protein n=1 Tax=Sphingomonas xanthus TaxID=2594473 RepID=A0A516IP62_9SPHN|nr:SPOR domain-containing protein [Sphingomonas xanthus]QDP18679.1 hypothetical protein FMM02_01125 [Sphingomonas xanthus]